MIPQIIISTLLVLGFLYLSSKSIYRCFLQNKYKTVIELLDYFLNKTYTVIYNDQIIAYTASGQKMIPADEMETIERNFIKMAFELMGPENEKMMVLFFGSKTVMINNMVMYVRKELESDAIAEIIQKQEINI